ncbi:hypothetical protein CK503_14170 [Aliifodinibius salipaludis]|uniref:Uncharacterized protein n=1 Tax=Fodinibius salipaludis TaxID=2032627 RepID=A0A2A2G605_9BACT|nr:nuclear transport factor 2 family protein [Aliifodinibius salipaludis]PAU93061.1 hypothetical protein CK503_14170 [Aliifodinibius salipaludis]
MNFHYTSTMKPLIHIYKIGCITGLVALLIMGIANSGNSQDISLIADPANGAAPTIKKHLLKIEQSINHPKSWKGISLSGDHPAIGLLNNLIDKKDITSIRFADAVHLLSHTNGTYEVRDIYVKTAETDTLNHQALSLRFNSKAQLTGVELLPQIYNYKLALDRKIEASVDAQKIIRKRVLQFQQALRAKNGEALSAMLSTNAHLVKGGISRFYHNDILGPYYKYQILSPHDYIGDITDQDSPQYQIQFDNLEVYVLPTLKDVFVVTFHQQWITGTYADDGYVAMVIDLKNDNIPLRIWKNKSFDTGYLQADLTHIPSMPSRTLTATPLDHPQEEFTFDAIKTDSNATEASGFFSNHKRWLLMGLGASAAITTGTILLTGDSDSGLPDPPGRPAFK